MNGHNFLGITVRDAFSSIDLSSISKGLLILRMTTEQIDLIQNAIYKRKIILNF